MATAVCVDGNERRAHLGIGEAETERVEQRRELRLIDQTVTVVVDALEAITQRVGAHSARLRRFAALENQACAAAFVAVCGCRAPSREQPRPPPGNDAALLLGSLHPLPSASAPPPPGLPPLRAEWLEQLPTRAGLAVVTPPLGATAPSRVIVAVHGAGDRPEWACGGWRLASQSTAFVVCPQGRPLSATTFAWASSAELARQSDAALDALRARYVGYVDDQPPIYAGFSQGATLAEPYLLNHAARFPIVILAEGGYRTLASARFARSFREGGGQRIAIVCGTPSCFTHARGVKPRLEQAGIEVLIVGDERAGHNLNERMQRALQNAWPQIAAPLRPSP